VCAEAKIRRARLAFEFRDKSQRQSCRKFIATMQRGKHQKLYKSAFKLESALLERSNSLECMGERVVACVCLHLREKQKRVEKDCLMFQINIVDFFLTIFIFILSVL
jgi:hypothetical protein